MAQVVEPDPRQLVTQDALVRKSALISRRDRAPGWVQAGVREIVHLEVKTEVDSEGNEVPHLREREKTRLAELEVELRSALAKLIDRTRKKAR